MAAEHQLTFGPFRLDLAQGCLWQGPTVVGLRPRSLALLCYLVKHPQCLVTKAELRQHVWGGTHVSDTVLRVCVQEIRAALGDAAAAPRYLETVGRQGYRFLGSAPHELPAPAARAPAGLMVGRQTEVAAVERWFHQAAQGVRQVGFVSGDAGVGKTTLLELWLARQGAKGEGRVVWGQCVEHYGEGEPYLPLLEAWGQLCRGPHRQEVLVVLRQYAPLWLLQLPGLVSEPERERVQRQVEGATAARMLRELTDALAALSAETPLVVVLEDLHWSDPATVEALGALAQQRGAARLLVVGTYRPVEALLQRHPLRGMVQELRGRGRAVELRVELLSAADVEAYVAGRLGGPVTAALAAFVHARTEGNALFMVNIVEHLVQQGLVVRQAGQWTLRDGAAAPLAQVPEALQQLLLRRIEALAPAARQVLEAASVVGWEFAVAAVAAGVHGRDADIEAQCDTLATQHHFLADLGVTVWPDGTRGGCYAFQHALYQQTLYEQLGTARRMQCHRHIGLRLEAGHGARVGEVAAQLAMHFERGGEVERALYYLQQAADNATRRNAHHEAFAALTKALALAATLPESLARTQHELTLLLLLGNRLMAAQGYGVPAVGEVYTRALMLSQQVGEPRQRCQALQGLARFHLVHAQLPLADEVSQQCFHLASQHQDSTLVQESYMDLGVIAFYRGDVATARRHLEHSMHLADGCQAPLPRFTGGYEARVTSLIFLALTLWTLGYADQAHARMQDALARAQQVEHTPSLAWAHLFAALLAQHRRDAAATQAYAEAMLALATAQGFTHRVAHGHILQGWALAMQGDAVTGVAHIQQGLTAVPRGGPRLFRPYGLALLAEAYGEAGQPDLGLPCLAEAVALVEATEGRWWEAELYRLQGALLLDLPLPAIAQATACFHQALAVARRQQATVLELRAAVSLSRLWQQQGHRQAAYDLLRDVARPLNEGGATADLQEAQHWLAILERACVSPTHHDTTGGRAES